MVRRKSTPVGKYSSRKGKAAMNRVCKYLSEVFAGQKFMRNLKTLSGDMFTSVEFPYVIEVKNVETWRYSHFLNCEGTIKCTIRKFWKQVIRDTKLANNKIKKSSAKNNLANKKPWLIFTKNNEPYYLPNYVCDDDFVRYMEDVNHVYVNNPRLIIFPMPSPEVMRQILEL
jgi:hypothetical protein